MEPAPRAKRILITKGKGGLGNRLLALLGSIEMCKAAQRSLLVDWTDGTYGADRQDAFAHAFRLVDLPVASWSEVSDDVYPVIWRGQLKLSVDEIIQAHDPSHWDREMQVYARYSVPPDTTDRAESVVVRWSYHDDFDSMYRELGYRVCTGANRIRALRRTLARHLRVAPPVLARIEPQIAATLTQPTIGIHIRQTDNEGPLRAQLRTLDDLARRERSARIFIATDNADVLAMLHARYPRRVRHLDKPLPEPGIPLHHAFQTRQALEEALADMVALSRCTWLIYSSRSTLGLVASLMSGAPAAHKHDCVRLGERLKRLGKYALANARELGRPLRCDGPSA